jgi:two-component sensor histidine kinase
MPASGSRVAMSETDESKQHHGGVKPSALQHNLTLDEGGEKRLHDLLSLLPAAVYTTDAAGRITFYNETAAALWGRRPTLNVDTCCGSARMYWPDGTPLPPDQCPMTVVLKEGRAVAGQEALIERPDGTRMQFMAFPSPLRDATGKVVGAVNMFVDITERKRSEAQVAILVREAEHRAKNMLATVQATVRLSQSDTPEGLKQAIEGRIQALANVHALFEQSRWTGAGLHSLVTQELSPYCQDGETRVRCDGPNVLLEPQMAQTIAVTLHELATNAAKYGALSAAKGHVQVRWSLAADGRIILRWTEIGGPLVKPPRRQGFGTRVMEGMIRGQLKGEMHFDWHAEGLTCEVVLPGLKLSN